MSDKKLNITSLIGAKNSFNKTLALVLDVDKTDRMFEALRAGLIQNFETAYELSWKTMKRYIEIYQAGDMTADFLTRKDFFRKAAAMGLIADPVKWFGFTELRNRTVHTYAEEIAEAVYAAMEDFGEELNSFVDALEKRLAAED
ncbi:MAG: nucleotidyltransferase substrate binding protein [Ruminococcus sp.]|jgi:nucleotidyltransferase substrate binding protein (TIGR01987 family)|nr:nucleotidyltransferase substrate binding protein [Ruminococcus sp.]